MANIALVIAGGVGARMGQDIPKQFINVYDKPVIIYTLEAFQKHKDIDAIEVVCLDGWHEVLRAYAKQFGIAKLENIVSGGKNGQESAWSDEPPDDECHGPTGTGRLSGISEAAGQDIKDISRKF